MLEFRILGPLEVTDDGGSPIPLGGQKQRALLASLLLARGDVVSTDRLADDLWGDERPRTAQTSLQNFVSQLRRALGPDVIETKPPGYRIRVAPDQLDAARFERDVAAARSAPPEQRAQRLRDALGLWRGAPLADFGYELFAQNEARRLSELRLVALEEALAAEVELGRHVEAVPELEALVRDEPLRERPRHQLMLALYRAGRQADALAVYEDMRRVLVDELGIDPSPELQRIHLAILRQETRLEAVRPTDVGDSVGDVVRALVGGRLVPVLGPSAHPLGANDVVEHLAKSFGSDGSELTRVAQHIALLSGSGPLHDVLHELYGSARDPGSVHRFLASLPPLLRAHRAPHQLIVTTGYDLALEQAFVDAGEEIDVVVYLASGGDRGKFLHIPPAGEPTVIEVPNTYATELSLERRTVVLRLHGRVDPGDAREWESFVVTEDDYIGYLAPGELPSMIPVSLAARLRRSHFLFLGYALRDWHLRLLLNRMCGDDPIGYRSWCVQPEAAGVEVEFWRQRGIELYELPIDEYVETLARRLEQVSA